MRIQANRLAQRIDRLVALVFRHQHLSEVVLEYGNARAKLNRPLQEGKPFLTLSRLMQSKPEIMQGVGMVRLLRQDVTVALLGLGPFSPLMLGQSGVEFLFDPGHVLLRSPRGAI